MGILVTLDDIRVYRKSCSYKAGGYTMQANLVSSIDQLVRKTRNPLTFPIDDATKLTDFTDDCARFLDNLQKFSTTNCPETPIFDQR